MRGEAGRGAFTESLLRDAGGPLDHSENLLAAAAAAAAQTELSGRNCGWLQQVCRSESWELDNCTARRGSDCG